MADEGGDRSALFSAGAPLLLPPSSSENRMIIHTDKVDGWKRSRGPATEA